ncbi:MAG TPA: hypothetical protein PKU91_08595, partial [Phycisphaerales bacterium]|nr:hypothetical protein [Phycisphaerales bacterium]
PAGDGCCSPGPLTGGQVEPGDSISSAPSRRTIPAGNACCPCAETSPELPHLCLFPPALAGQKGPTPALNSPPRWEWSGVNDGRVFSASPRASAVHPLGDGAWELDRLCSWQV